MKKAITINPGNIIEIFDSMVTKGELRRVLLLTKDEYKELKKISKKLQKAYGKTT